MNRTTKESPPLRHTQWFKSYSHTISDMFSVVIVFQPEMLHRIVQRLYTLQSLYSSSHEVSFSMCEHCFSNFWLCGIICEARSFVVCYMPKTSAFSESFWSFIHIFCRPNCPHCLEQK
jgi:hypothetical protein